MKKFLCYSIIAVFASLSIISCTEDEVTPTTQADTNGNNGGGGSDPK